MRMNKSTRSIIRLPEKFCVCGGLLSFSCVRAGRERQKTPAVSVAPRHGRCGLLTRA